MSICSTFNIIIWFEVLPSIPCFLDQFCAKKKVTLFMTNDGIFFVFTPNYAPIHLPSSEIFVSTTASTSLISSNLTCSLVTSLAIPNIWFSSSSWVYRRLCLPNYTGSCDWVSLMNYELRSWKAPSWPFSLENFSPCRRFESKTNICNIKALRFGG